MPSWSVRYHDLVVRDDIPQLPGNICERIRKAIESRLTVAPDRYGRRLRRSLSGYWRLRVGDYRVIYEIEADAVRIWMIGHRKLAYQAIEQRLGRKSG